MRPEFRFDGELRHYFRHADFGAPSAQLEILGGTNSTELEMFFGEVSSSRKPRWPEGAIHSIMVRVFERLILAEGHPLLGISLPTGQSFPGKYPRYEVKRKMYEFSWGKHLAREEHRVGESSPGAWLTLWAYYGPFGLGRRYAEGKTFDNTKDGPQDCDDPEIALWPLIGEIQRNTRGDDLETLLDKSIDPKSKALRDTGHAEGIREALDRARRDIRGDARADINRRANALLNRAKSAYVAAAELHDRINLLEVTSGL